MTAQLQINHTKRNKQLNLFVKEDETFLAADAISQVYDIFTRFGPMYDVWGTTFSGGKDSGAVLSLVMAFITNGLVPAPKKLIVLRSDTTHEIPLLMDNAERFMQAINDYGQEYGFDFEAITVKPEPHERWFAQIFGKGLPPVHPGMKGRWCTRTMKVDPMARKIEELANQFPSKMLMLTGVRLGESEKRDSKLKAGLERALQDPSRHEEIHYPSCSVESGECGSGIWAETKLSKFYDAVPLILNWKVCHIFDWLQGWENLDTALHDVERADILPAKPFNYLPYTKFIAKAYGQYDDGTLENEKGRFGDMGCSAIEKDYTLIRLAKTNPGYMEVNELYDVWGWLWQPQNRLGKVKDGKPKPGPITISARIEGLEWVHQIEAKSGIKLIDDEQLNVIHSMIQANRWPRGWTGNEPTYYELLASEVSRQQSQMDLGAA